MDKYNERLVKGKPGAAVYAAIIGFALLITAGLYLTITWTFGVLILVVGIVGVCLSFSGTNIEYEYIMTNGDIDIAKIISMKNRKAIKEIKAGDILCFDRADSNKVTHDIESNPDIVVCDYTPQVSGEVYYAVYTNEKGKKTINLLDLDEKCVEHIKFYIKSKSLI